MAESLESQRNKYRYERKYLLGKEKLSFFLKKLYLERFNEKYPPRKINNIYFDSKDFLSLYETVEGFSNRTKYRVRWYGEVHDNSNKTLELKSKSEFLNTKNQYHLGLIKFNNPIDLDLDDIKILVSEKLNYKQNIHPVLINNYKRRYFVNEKLGLRVTIDSEQNFYSIYSKVSVSEYKNLVVEIKYKKELFFINNYFDLELSKNSKYENGLKLTMNSIIKKN